MHKLQRWALIVPVLCLSALALAQEQAHDHPQEEVGHYHVSISRDPNLTWDSVLESALTQSTEAAIGLAREEQAQAYQRLSRRLITGAPRLEVDHYGDGVFDDLGFEEWEVGLNMDLWRFGQRSNAKDLSREMLASSTAWQQYHRWQISGQLRQLFYYILEAEIGVQQQQRFVEISQQLVAATETLHQAGAVARVDVMQVQNLHLQQQQLLLEAEAEMVDAERNYAIFSGLDRMPDDVVGALPKLIPEAGDQAQIEMLEESLAQSHPRLRFIKSLENVSAAELKQQTLATKGAPTARISVRRDKADASSMEVDSLGLSFTVPFGGGGSARAAASNIGLQKAEYASQWYQSHRQISLDLHEVEHELSVVKNSIQLLDTQLTLNQSRWQLAITAFENGETNLTDTLWVFREVVESEKQSALMHLRLQQLYSDYYQTLGATP